MSTVALKLKQKIKFGQIWSNTALEIHLLVSMVQTAMSESPLLCRKSPNKPQLGNLGRAVRSVPRTCSAQHLVISASAGRPAIAHFTHKFSTGGVIP